MNNNRNDGRKTICFLLDVNKNIQGYTLLNDTTVLGLVNPTKDRHAPCSPFILLESLTYLPSLEADVSIPHHMRTHHLVQG